MIIKKLFLIIILSSLALMASEESTTKTMELEVIGEHYTPVSNSNEIHSSMYFNMYYKPSSWHKFAVWQPVEKVYTINPGEQEFQPQDTKLFYYGTLSKNLLGTKTSLIIRPGIFLPTSAESDKNDLMFSSRMQFRLSRNIGPVNIQYWPEAAYNFYRYTTTINGKPLNEYAFLHTILTQIPVISTLSVVGAFSTNSAFTFNSGVKDNLGPNSKYALAAYLAYGFFDLFTARVGYSQGDSFTKAGYNEFNAYDSELTETYTALDLNLEF